MKYQNKVIFFFLFLIGVLLLSNCKKDKLPRVSFPEIVNMNVDPISRTKATINFKLEGDIVDNDPVTKIEIYFSKENSGDLQVKPIPVNAELVELTGLEPVTYYTYEIHVWTNEREMGNSEPFVFIGETFKTSSIDVVVDTNSIIEFEESIMLSVKGIIRDNVEVDLNDIDSIGHVWKYWKSGVEHTRYSVSEYAPGSNQITAEGIYTSVLELADFTLDTFYIQALVVLSDGSFSKSAAFAYGLQSKGDFWVKINSLNSLNTNLELVPNTSFENVFEGVEGLEGAVSFVRTVGAQEYAYVGLGFQPNGAGDEYPVKFYRYDALRNVWSAADIPDFPLGAGRMFAVSFINGNDIYIGAGCRNCANYYKFCDENPPPNLIDELMVYKDLYRLTDNGWELQLNTTGEPQGRFGAYGIYSGQPLMGGGIAKKYKGDKNGNGVLDEGEWLDGINVGDMPNSVVNAGNLCFSIGTIPYFGEWIDINQDKIFDSGEWDWDATGGPVDNVFDSGDWIDSNLDGVFNYGDSVEVGVPPVEVTASNFLSFFFELDDPDDWEDSNFDGIYSLNDMVGNDTVMNNNYMEFLNFEIPMNWTDQDNNSIIGLDDLVNGTQLTPFNFVDILNIENFNYSLGEWEWNAGEHHDLVFDSGEWDWKPDVGSDGEFTFNGGDWNPVGLESFPFEVVYYEWDDFDDTGNCNGVVDEGEIDFTLRVDTFMYEYNPGSDQWQEVSSVTDNIRFGAQTWELGNAYYMIGGTNDLVGNDHVEKLYFFNTVNDNWESMGVDIPGSFKARNFAFSFEIEGEGYIGSGESITGDVITPDLWRYDQTSFDPQSGCGVEGMTRGISFSLGDKGFVAFGVSSNEATSNRFIKEVWMYLPEK